MNWTSQFLALSIYIIWIAFGVTGVWVVYRCLVVEQIIYFEPVQVYIVNYSCIIDIEVTPAAELASQLCDLHISGFIFTQLRYLDRSYIARGILIISKAVLQLKYVEINHRCMTVLIYTYSVN